MKKPKPDPRCTCADPKPVDAAEDEYSRFFGTVIWISGADYVACERCGGQLSAPVRRDHDADPPAVTQAPKKSKASKRAKRAKAAR